MHKDTEARGDNMPDEWGAVYTIDQPFEPTYYVVQGVKLTRYRYKLMMEAFAEIPIELIEDFVHGQRYA